MIEYKVPIKIKEEPDKETEKCIINFYKQHGRKLQIKVNVFSSGLNQFIATLSMLPHYIQLVKPKVGLHLPSWPY